MGLLSIPALHRMTWQTGIDRSCRTLAAVHCQAALFTLGRDTEELTLNYFRDGTPDPEGQFSHIIVTMRWAQLATVDLSPTSRALCGIDLGGL
jgi:hypothetical protein